MKEFLRIIEMVKPSRFINNALRWCGLGRPMKDREKMLRAFFLKAVYDLPTTKGLIENLKTNPSLRRLCGWEYRRRSPIRSDILKSVRNFCPRKNLRCNPCIDCAGKLYRQISGTRKPLIQPRSSVARKLAARTRRNSSSKRNVAGKVKRKSSVI